MNDTGKTNFIFTLLIGLGAFFSTHNRQWSLTPHKDVGVFLSTYYVAPSRHAEERSDVGISQRRGESAAIKEVKEFREVREIAIIILLKFIKFLNLLK